MAAPIRVTVTLAAADADGICASQTPGAAGDLTINGALASGGVATITAEGIERQVLITCAGNETGKTFTVYGTNATGNEISDTVAGPNATTGTTSKFFRTVTRVAISAAAAGAVTVGTNGVGSTRFVSIDQNKTVSGISYEFTVTGTVNYDLQHTLNDPNRFPVTWFDDTNIASETTDQLGAINFPVVGSRCLINSGTGTVVMTVVQMG